MINMLINLEVENRGLFGWIPASIHCVFQDISMNINVLKHFGKFVHWAHGRYMMGCEIIMKLRFWWRMILFPPASAVEGIKSVPSVCPSVRLPVIQHSHGWTVWHTDLKFGGAVDLDNISDEFEGQGQRSRSPGWKTWFPKFQMAELHRASLSWHLTSCDVTAWRHVTSRYDITMSRDVIVGRHDVTAWRLDILWRLLSKNTDKEGTSWEGASTLRRFHKLKIKKSIWYLVCNVQRYGNLEWWY